MPTVLVEGDTDTDNSSFEVHAVTRHFPFGRGRSLTARSARRVVDRGVGARSGDSAAATGLRRRVGLLGGALSIALATAVAPPVLADEDDRRDELNARGADLDEHLD